MFGKQDKSAEKKLEGVGVYVRDTDRSSPAMFGFEGSPTCKLPPHNCLRRICRKVHYKRESALLCVSLRLQVQSG